MPKLGNHRSAWKIQRSLMVELPGLGKPGALERRPFPPGQHGLKAKSGRSTDWMGTLIALLETRLDNVVFRLGFAGSMSAARQLVRHGKVRVNGAKIDIPSAQVRTGAEITLTPQAYIGTVYQYSIKQPRLMLPDWLGHVEHGEFKQGRLKATPTSDAVPFPLDGRLVAEFYSGI